MAHPFEELGLRPELVRAVVELGYENATPIQIGAIPALLQGRDMIGQAQTGTGKTAAFALPLLQRLDPSVRGVQALILTPTRELALQVAEATQNYARHTGARVLAIYGGSSYVRQMKQLSYGVQIVVGTPGRILDLIKQGALVLSEVRFLVLDEADEMLSMGFIEDVETIVASTPAERQTALFSATMPEPIVRLSERYMHDPARVSIEHKTLTLPQIEQRYYLVQDSSKLAAVSRLLEVEDVTGALIFARTKIGVATLAESLINRGFPAEALHGDLNQDARETVLRRFRNGQLLVLVATDVVARGIDIHDVSHVINFDVPYDAEDYVHRIGRTGRAGREGIAITLVTPRERRWLKTIESFTRQRMNRGTMPTPQQVLARRNERFQTALTQVLEQGELEKEGELLSDMMLAGYELGDIAAAAIRMVRAQEQQRPIEEIREVSEYSERPVREDRYARDNSRSRRQEPGMVRLLLNLGRAHGIQPGDVVGAIASEAGIPGRAIGAIDIRHNETYVDVKDMHVERVLKQMRRSTLRGQSVKLMLANSEGRAPQRDEPERRKMRKPF